MLISNHMSEDEHNIGKIQVKAHPVHIFRRRQLLFFSGNVWVSGSPFNWLSSEKLQAGPYVLDIPQP